MKTTNSLPKYWVVQCNTSNPNWKKVIDYLHKVHGYKWEGGCNGEYYGYDGNTMWSGTNTYSNICFFENSPTLLTIEEFVEMTKAQTNKSKETMKTITHTQAQSIFDIACITWKDKLFELWGKAIISKQDVDISDDFYKEMREACTSEQHQLFDEIFGEESKFKVGDWVYVIDAKSGAKGANHCIGQITNEVSNMGLLSWEDGINISIGSKVWKVNIKSELRFATEKEIQKAKYIPKGTPCLVRDLEEETWKFAYSSGDGKFITRISNLGWKQVQVLDMNNLPKY